MRSTLCRFFMPAVKEVARNTGLGLAGFGIVSASYVVVPDSVFLKNQRKDETHTDAPSSVGFKS